MCAQREALRARMLASAMLSAACLAHVRHPVGEAIALAFDLDLNVPEDELLLIERINDIAE